MDSLHGILYGREVSDLAVRSRTYRTLYGNRRLIDDLDIVNELDGHSGCVNALSWSKSGSLLASGSDDQHLNVHSYQPDASTAQFRLITTVATGHTANIFSVKFMPHSNDRTVITAAGDAQVRVFDLEHAGQTTNASAAASMASEGRRRTRSIYNDVRYLTDGDTDCRVYRSHGDRVKRIVTESSPYLFLTCSEDGEVRQWDLRQPSSAYPPPPGGRLSSSSGSDVPPPLISYKRYNLDLNTISCSASQPHYIALGGAHLHAFLHDRRMTGRDRLKESGQPLPSIENMTKREEELMSQATQCVRKFAPAGQRKMKRTDNGHITACKISDARPNEMVVSWSGEHIYSFDLVHSPDADEEDVVPPLQESSGSRVKESRDRKRKRKPNDSESSLSTSGTARASSKARTQASEPGQETAIRVRYQNGQTEDIPIPSLPNQRSELSAKERKAQNIALYCSKIRTAFFGPPEQGQSFDSQLPLVLSRAGDTIYLMDDGIREWRYPMDPPEERVLLEQTLRSNRESARRFVQAAGTLARALGGKPQTTSGHAPFMVRFTSIEAKSNELPLSQREHFGYDFLKAIVLWLESGVGRLIEGFSRPASMLPNVRAAQRLPIPEPDATTEPVDEILIPYLLRLASDRPVTNVEANRFEVDENTQLFSSEKDAVRAFAAAVKIPFADLSSAVLQAEGGEVFEAQDRRTALRYWGRKVARGILLNAAEGVNFSFISGAFGGPMQVVREVGSEEDAVGEPVSEGEDDAVQAVEVVDQGGDQVDGLTADDAAAALRETNQTAGAVDGEDEEDEDDEEHDELAIGEDHDELDEEVDEDDDDDDEDDDEYPEDEDSDEISEPDEEDGVPNSGLHRMMYTSAFERRKLKEKVEADVPCSGSSRVYRGHCNVKTVKDVNYFGANDEYVVSGSDDGNFFMWDRLSGELVNVLEGDGEVVNVVQGHPYEPLLAVSGIDHTIKIFSPDARAREVARMGSQGISAHDASAFSSLSWPSRHGRRRITSRRANSNASPPAATEQSSSSSEPAVPRQSSADDEEDGDAEGDDAYVAPSGLRSRRRMKDSYRICSQNEAERQGGNQDAFLTRSMLAQLAHRIRAHRAATGRVPDVGVERDEGEDRVVVRLTLGDDCVLQ